MILYTKYPLKKYSLTSQEEEVQGRRSRNPSFSKSVNPQSNSNRRGGRRSRTASEGDSWTTVASSDSTQRSAQGQTLYSGRHSSGSMGSSTYINTSSKVNHSAAKMQHPYKVNNLIEIISTNDRNLAKSFERNINGFIIILQHPHNQRRPNNEHTTTSGQQHTSMNVTTSYSSVISESNNNKGLNG